MKALTAILFFLPALALAAADEHAPYQQLIDNPKHLGDGERLHQLFKVDWDHGVRQSPEFATDLGVPGLDDQWTDMSEAAIAVRKREAQWPLDVLNTIHRDSLNAANQLNYDVFRHNAEESIEDNRFPGEDLPISQLGGVQQAIPQTIDDMPHTTVAQYEHIIGRMRNAGALIDQNIALLKDGVKAGVVQPAIVMEKVPDQVLKVIPDDPMKSAILEPFQNFPAGIAQPDRDRLKAEAIKAYQEVIVPGYRRLHDYLADEYLQKCRQTIGWSALPDGAAWYIQAVRDRTTTDMTPEQIHELGLSEVKGIRVKMEQVADDCGYKGRYGDFIHFLRTDPQFYYTDPDALLAGYRDIAKQIDPVLPEFFGKLPRLTYGVRAIPAFAAESAPAAYYMSGSEITGRPGWFCANTYNLPSRPKWQMQVLTLHESVPGHHLQISLAQEMENVPEFRKYSGYTAYTEGWALYCERLGYEMGFYKDSYSKFGQLTFDMWRACRLVVDTGIHTQGWTRQQAIDYMMTNAGKDEHEATAEVDRYITWPGQALAYKIGQLKFLELRAKAEQELGSQFNLRAFHDELLANGALPLPILEEQIDQWIANQKKS